jgi:hypothetical protein
VSGVKPLILWKYNQVTGFWNPERTIKDETMTTEWLEIFEKDEPGEFFRVSRFRPNYNPTLPKK